MHFTYKWIPRTVLRHIYRTTLGKTCRCRERNRCLSSNLLLSCHSAPTTYFKLASLPGRTITTQQPQFAPSDCLMSSHTLTLQPQQRPYPNHTNFPLLPTNPPQIYSARRQEITVCWFRFSKSQLRLGFMPAGVNVIWNNCIQSDVH